MDEWFDVETGREVPASHPLSFEKADASCASIA
jgi:hypothetical protein